MSRFNENISRASLNEDIPNSFQVFRFSAQSNATHKKFVSIVGFKILFSRLFCTHASVVEKEHALKLKAFASNALFLSRNGDIRREKMFVA